MNRRISTIKTFQNTTENNTCFHFSCVGSGIKWLFRYTTICKSRKFIAIEVECDTLSYWSNHTIKSFKIKETACIFARLRSTKLPQSIQQVSNSTLRNLTQPLH